MNARVPWPNTLMEDYRSLLQQDGTEKKKPKKSKVPAGELPLYGTNGKLLNKEKSRLPKWLVTIIIFASALAILLLSIYLPQFFMDKKNNEWLIQPNPDALQLRQAYIVMNKDADFDGDGLTNGEEQALGTRIYGKDSDKDGIHDGDDRVPLQDDGTMLRALMTAGNNYKSPFEMNGVILWADDESSYANGGVIETMTGYRFYNFKGIAKFAAGSRAYLFENGRHTLLKYKEKEDAWEIPGDCVVTVTNRKPEETNEFTIFGHSTYIRSGFGEFLSGILPDNGWLTCRNMWVDDTMMDISMSVKAKRTTVTYDPNDMTRFESNTNSLTDLVNVYRTLDNGSAVLVSLVNANAGEVVLKITGYTPDGNLIVEDPEDSETRAILYIRPACRRAAKQDGTIYMDSWFDFYGCGFDSAKNNDTISFFTAAAETAADIW